VAKYKTRRNYVDHDFNSTTLTINGEHKAEGLEMIEVERTEDETVVVESGDGMAMFSNSASRSGTIKFQVLDASATNDVMWDLHKAGTSFKLSVLDVAAPNLDCKGAQCRVQKRPIVKRSKEVDVVEWVCIVAYLDAVGGSYTLVTP